MIAESQTTAVGLLLSGGLDSCILLSYLLEQGYDVQPFYIRSNLVWQFDELAAVERLLHAFDSPRLGELVILDLLLADLYQDHWSVTGDETPDETTQDEAVFLPGRNALLMIKAALWCQLHGIQQLALASLRCNPFADSSDEFFDDLQSALNHSSLGRLELLRPFAHLRKHEVMQLGRKDPLELTFSCISPLDGLHCGQCNKCAERRAAFDLIGSADPTHYAARGRRSAAQPAGAAQ